MPTAYDKAIAAALAKDVQRPPRLLALQPAQETARGGNKYGARKCEYNGLRFDSQKERRDWQDLEARQAACEIAGLRQGKRGEFRLEVNGVLITTYTPDAVYTDCATGQTVVQDSKSEATARARDYPLRKKLMRACFGITIVEIGKE